MRKIKDVLRLRLSGGLSIRQIRASTKISVGAIQKLLARADEPGLTWPLPPELDEAALARLFYPAAEAGNAARFEAPDWPAIHLDLKRPDMTKQLAWEEYTARFPNRCYSYSQFCARYRSWRQSLKRSMRQGHRAGEKLFVDYPGQTVHIVEPSTGAFWPAQVFVAVLGASNYTYAEATRSQTLPDWPDWLDSHGLAGQPCARVRVLRWPARGGRARQPQKRGQFSLSLRSGTQPQLPATGRALPGGGHPGAAL